MLLLYTHTITSRLQYIVDFFSKELFDTDIAVTTDLDYFREYDGPRLNYSSTDNRQKEFFIKATPLLFEADIRLQPIECFELNYQKVFFQTSGDLPFDVLAATFYLISRYEEYLPHQKDFYGRYDVTEALAYREGFLHLPVVNYWLRDFAKALQQKFPRLIFKRKNFEFIPTYDIDIAYSYQEKGLFRSLGGFARSALKKDWYSVRQRWRVLRRIEKDPFDAYEWMDALHLYCKVNPIYFFLVAQHQQGYDKNIPTSSRALQELIDYFAKEYKVGLHPSWQSSEDFGTATLKEEKEWLETITDKPIDYSRQHYIKFTLPETYRRLIQCGIRKDYSMGYGSRNGFRASVASSFYWFDLQQNETTPLRLFPFCFMDANAFYEQQLSPQLAYEEMVQYYNTVKKINGLLITIWHNNFLGTDKTFATWKAIYEIFMKENIYWDAYSY